MEIRNPALGTTLTLDWSHPGHLVRTSEDGQVDQAGRDGAGGLSIYRKPGPACA